MGKQSEILQNLIDSFAKLPGIGKKSARRISYYLINSDTKVSNKLAEAVTEAKKKLGLCRICHNLTENEICEICSDGMRDSSSILIVESFSDLYMFEKLNVHKGLYHVVGGLISPLDGIVPSSLNLSSLFLRVHEKKVRELIIGLNHSVEGDTTALYISEKLKDSGINITRLATGIPIGGEIEFTDEITLKQAFMERRNF
ncbi:MAG: recombination mediator RecR [Candidatus Delongbacteria bacterium]|jgi:recombination protein RecR|nr:recombination mediator RecR [Candidatus Delongbacteria bacterium]